VYAEEPLGDRTIYDLRLGNTPFKVRMPPSSTFAQGSRVWLRINTERIHLFDPRTDQAIR
jgi:multiple sugar transport system ATP-binding protein